MVRLTSDKVTLSNKLETLRVQLDKETLELMQADMYPDTIGQEIAQSICKLLPASCKTLKKLTFEAMDRSGQDPLHIAAKDIKSRIEMKYESESLPMSDCDSEDRDR